MNVEAPEGSFSVKREDLINRAMASFSDNSVLSSITHCFAAVLLREGKSTVLTLFLLDLSSWP